MLHPPVEAVGGSVALAFLEIKVEEKIKCKVEARDLRLMRMEGTRTMVGNGGAAGGESGLQQLDQHLDELLLHGRKLIRGLQDLVQKRWLKQLTAGAISGAMTKTIVAPLETVRTRLIINGGQATMGMVFGDVLQREGWRGFWAGNGVNVLRVAPSNAIEFATYETVKKAMTAAQKRQKRRRKEGHATRTSMVGRLFDGCLEKTSPSGVAGASAGVVAAVICYPLEVMKDRITMDPSAHDSIRLSFQHVIEREGWTALYRGLTPTLIGMVPYSAAYYYFYDLARKKYSKFAGRKHLHWAETLALGGMSGVAASSLTFPLEVARKRMMVGSVGGTRVIYKNVLDSLVTICRDEGVGGLYKGIGPSSLKCLSASGISWTLYEGCKNVLHVGRAV